MTNVLQEQDTTNKAWFQTLFKIYEEGLNGHSNRPIAHFRKAGFNQFQEVDFPTRRDEDWKYTSVTRILNNKYQEGSAPKLTKTDIEPFLFPGLNAVQLVFVNGIWVEELSQMEGLPSGVQILPVREALEDDTWRTWMEKQVQQESGTGKNTFLPLNQAFASQGVVIGVNKNFAFDRPIHLVNISAPGSEPHITHPQVFVWASRGSAVTFIQSYQATQPEGTYFNNAVTYVDVEANAEVKHYRLQFESKEGFQVNNILVRQDRDSRYTTYGVDLGGRIVRNNLSALHLDSGIETHLYGAYLGNGEQHIDNQTFIDHAVPHCQSNELYKGILTDKARGVFNGKVMVRQDAQKTNAFQQNSSLVLSPKAVMDTKPQLEIYADDVRCSHGATIGSLDETSVFYLRSRGIPEAKAKYLLQRAFVGEAIDNMDNEIIRERVYEMMEGKLGTIG